MYELTDAQRQEKLDAARCDDPGVLADEIALLRTLINESVNAGKVTEAEKLLSCLSRVQTAHVNAMVRSGCLIERDRLTKICLAMAGLLSDSLRAHGLTDDRHNLIVDYVIERVPETVKQFDVKSLGPQTLRDNP
jgi:hypothetical protein